MYGSSTPHVTCWASEKSGPKIIFQVNYKFSWSKIGLIPGALGRALEYQFSRPFSKFQVHSRCIPGAFQNSDNHDLILWRNLVYLSVLTLENRLRYLYEMGMLMSNFSALNIFISICMKCLTSYASSHMYLKSSRGGG